jgi:hypothetical protein
MGSQKALPVVALSIAILPWALLTFGAAYAYIFVSCAAGPQTFIDNCANIVMWCAVIGWWVSAIAFGLSLFSLFEVRSSTVAFVATWVSGIYCVPILLFVLLKFL